MLDKFVSHLTAKNYGKNTIKIYCLLLNKMIKEGILDESCSFVNIEKMAKSALSPASKKLRVAALVKYCKFMIHEGLLEKMPCVLIDAEIPKLERKLLFVDEQDELLGKLENIKDKSIKLLYYLLYSTGCRIDSLINLNIEHVNLQTGEIAFFTAKGNSYYQGVLPENVLLMFGDFIKDRVTGPLFETNGERISKEAMRLRIKRKLGDGYIKFHQIRHSIATHLIANGAALHDVQTFLNHKSPSTTTRYVHSSVIHKKKVLMGSHAFFKPVDSTNPAD